MSSVTFFLVCGLVILMDEAVKAGKISVVANIILTFLKGAAGLLSGSTALIADSIHSLVDVIGSALVWIGIKVSQKPPDEEHPYGHFKAESLAELAVGSIIIITSIAIALDAVNAIILKEGPKFEVYALLVAIISTLVNELLARYKISVGKREKSSSLIAEGKHSRTDVISSAAVALGLVLVYFGYWWADPVIALAISVLILQIGVGIVKGAVDVLMDKIDEDFSIRVRRFIEGIEGVKSVDFVAVRGTWRCKIAEVHVTIRDESMLEEVVKRIERIKEIFPEITRVIPVVKVSREVRKIAVPVNEEGVYIGDLNADYFLILDRRTGERLLVKNEFKDSKRMKGYLIANLLSRYGVDEILVRRIGEGAKNHLRSKGISVRISEDVAY